MEWIWENGNPLIQEHSAANNADWNKLFIAIDCHNKIAWYTSA